MRILYFTRDYTSHDYRFLDALSKTEHKLFYLQLEKRGHALENRMLPEGIENIDWAGGQKPVAFRDGAKLFIQLKRVIEKIRPDLIHAGPIQRSAFLVALTGFQPLVSMSWGYDLLQDANQNQYWRWATRYTLKRSAAFIGDCNTIRQIANSYGMPDNRIVTFPWGIDLKHFSTSSKKHPFSEDYIKPKEETNQTKKKFILLSTRNWEPIYGVEVIVRAFVKAFQSYPHLHLIMLGNGSQAELVQDILRQASISFERGPFKSHSSKSPVVFPGQITYDELPHYYRFADLYIAATHSDGTSISLLEAMACGLPVLVSDIPGNREWVNPGENGWLFPDGNSDILASRIIQAVEQQQHLSKMGKNARNIAEQRADWDKNFPNLLRAYDSAIGH